MRRHRTGRGPLWMAMMVLVAACGGGVDGGDEPAAASTTAPTTTATTLSPEPPTTSASSTTAPTSSTTTTTTAPPEPLLLLAFGDSFAARGGWPAQYAALAGETLGREAQVGGAVCSLGCTDMIRVLERADTRALVADADIIVVQPRPGRVRGPRASGAGRRAAVCRRPGGALWESPSASVSLPPRPERQLPRFSSIQNIPISRSGQKSKKGRFSRCRHRA